MARILAELPKGSRITDYISLGVVAKTFPLATVKSVLVGSGRGSIRQRELPAHVVVYYVIALALYMHCSYREVLRCLLEGVQWLLGPTLKIKVTGKSGISQARTRLGVEPLRQLHDEVVRPIAVEATKGAWYRNWRLVSLDGSTLDVADEKANDEAFGRPGASPGQERLSADSIRVVGGKRHARAVRDSVGRLRDRGNLPGQRSHSLPAARNAVPCGSTVLRLRALESSPYYRGRSALAHQEELAIDLRETFAGRFLLEPHLSIPKDRRHKTNGVRVRVVEYRLEECREQSPFTAC